MAPHAAETEKEYRVAEQIIPAANSAAWLKKYYLVRGLFSVAWVGAAVALGRENAPIAMGLLIAYPAWDAIANYVDAMRSGGLSRSPSQAFNVVVSVLTTIAVAVTIGRSMNHVLAVFAAWALLAGILQLATGVRRRKYERGQWAMILSGAQSTTAGFFFLKESLAPAVPSITSIAPYAAFGAFYFLLSAALLARAGRRETGAASISRK